MNVFTLSTFQGISKDQQSIVFLVEKTQRWRYLAEKFCPAITAIFSALYT